MPQTGNDDARDRHFDVWPGLVEHQKIEAFAFGEIDAGHHLFAFVQNAEFRAEVGLARRATVGNQIGMVLKPPWTGAVFA